MIHLFVPYYGVWPDYFQECLDSQTVPFRLFKYDRKEIGDGWTAACNLFYKEFKRYRGTEDDVICIMNNDIRFDANFLSEGCRVRPGTVLIPHGTGASFDWKTKSCRHGYDTFPGRAFFMTAPDFIKSGGFDRFIPHYLSDYDFGFRMTKGGMRIEEMSQHISHAAHSINTNPWMLRSVNSPLSWSIFLLKHGRNKYLLLNLLRAWAELFMLKNI